MNKLIKTVFCLAATILLATTAEAARTAKLVLNVSSNSSGRGGVLAAISDSGNNYDASSSTVSQNGNRSQELQFYARAQANAGYVFLGWSTSDNGTTYESTDISYALKITAPYYNNNTTTKTLYANFAPTERYVNFTANAVGSGTVAVNSSNTTPADSAFGATANMMSSGIPNSNGEVITWVFAKPADGYVLSYWSLDGGSTHFAEGNENPMWVGTAVTSANRTEGTAKADQVYAHFVKAVAYVQSNGKFYTDFLTAYNAAQDGDTIKLLQNVDDAYTLTLNKNMTYTSYWPDQKCGFTRTAAAGVLNIAAGKTMTLENFYFDGNNVTGNDSFIVVQEGAAVVLNNGAEIRNCKTAGNGGAIRSAGTVTLNSGSVINNCTTTGGKGGAIYVESGTVNANGGTISNCSAAQGGGAVYLAEGETNYATYYRFTIRQSASNGTVALSEIGLLDANGNRINLNSNGYTYDGNFTTASAATTAIAALQPEHVIITGGSITFYNTSGAGNPDKLFDGYADGSHSRTTITSPSFNGQSANYRSIVFRVPDGSAPAKKYFYNIGNSTQNSPTSWTLERSYDGVTWTQIDAQSGKSALGSQYAKSAEYTISNTDAGVATQGATMNVSGAPQITGNTSNSAANNVQPASATQVVLTGALTGAVGVNWPSSGVAVEQSFGTVSGSANGAENFKWDGDGTSGTRGSVNGSTLVWVTDPVCKIGSTTYYTLAAAVAAANNGDTIELIDDVKLSSDLTIGKNVTITSESGSTHTITRTNAGAEFTVSGAVTLANVTLDGDHLTGTDAFLKVPSGGSLTINDGTTIRNCARNADGGAIAVSGGTLTMNGGTITGNSAISGGAILIGSGTMTMNGGTISGNTAGHEGGAIAVGTYNTTDVATLNLRGGTITGNSCGNDYAGGGVSVQNNSSTIHVSGTPVVQGNTKGSAANDVSFNDVVTGTPIVQDGNLEAGAHLGVAVPKSGSIEGIQFGTGTSGVTGSNAFFYDGGNAYVGAVDSSGTLYWGLADPVCRLVSNGRVYSSLEGAYADATATDEIQMLKNLTLSYGTALPIGKNITLSSDPGHVYTLTRGAAGCVITVPEDKTLTLANITIDGANLEAASAMFQVEDGGTLTVNGGATIQNCRNVSSNGGAINAEGGATVNFAGTISNCSAAKGGAVYLGAGAQVDSQYYTYYRYTFKKSYGSQRLQMAELSLYDAAGNRVNGGGYTSVTKSAADLGPGEVTLTGNNSLNDSGTGADKLFDGNLNSRLLLSGGTAFNNAANESSWAYLTFRLKDGAAQPVTYSFTTFDQNYGDGVPARNPDIWTVEGSTDGVNWTQIDSRSGVGATPTALSTESTRFAFDTTKTTTTATAATMNLTGGTIAGCSAAEGGAVYIAGGAGSSAAPATVTKAYTYYKVVFKKTGNGEFQLSEVKLFDAGGNRINQGTYTALARNADPSTLNVNQCTYVTSSDHWNNEGPANVFDNNTSTKFGGQFGLTDASDSSKWVTLAFRVPDDAAPAASYMFTTANDTASYSGRNPTDWVIYGSADGTNWTELDSKSSFSGETANYTDLASTPWPIDGSYTTVDYATYYRWTIRETSNGTGFRLSEFVLLDANGNRINGGTANYTYDGLFTTDSAAATAVASLQPEHVIWAGGAMTFYADTSANPGVLFDGYADSSHNRITAQNMTFDGTAANSRSLVFRVPEGSNPAATYYFNNGSSANAPTSWTLERSYDGVTWTTISEVSGAAALANAYTKSPDYTITVADTGAPSGAADVITVLNVSGNPIVADNTVTGGSALNNIQPTATNQVTLAGSFGGSVGVNWPIEGEVEGAQFGVVASGDSAEGFFFDGDAAMYQGEVDGATLVWTMKATDAVCRIGETTYTSLKQAVEAAQAGDTIVLLKDIVQKTNLTVDKNVTIDGDGHKISRGAANGALTVSGNVTMQNLMIDGANVESTMPLVTVTGAGQLSMPTGVSVTRGAAGGVTASGAVKVAGTTSIAGNHGGNLRLSSGNLLSVTAPLTGTIAVSYPTTDLEGAQFATVGSYAVTGSDIRHFACDIDSSYRAKLDGGAIKWTNQNAHYPDHGKTIDQVIEETAGESLTVIEIDTSTGDGSDIVIPAGREMVIDLKGATLTMDVIANGNVTIIDSSTDKTGKLVGTLTENEGGDLTIEAGTFTQRPDEEWLAPNRIIMDNADDTYTVVAIEAASGITGCTLDTRRGVRLVENPYEDVLPLTYASSNWVFQASTNQALKSYVAVANALPIVDGDFNNAQWHDQMTDNVAVGPVGAGDKSYDYPSGNSNIVEITAQEMQYLGPNESEVVWQEWRYGLIQAVITNETGYLRAWYKFPDANSNIVPILPGDPSKEQPPDYPDPDDMNTPGDEDYPGYSVTNDVSHPWIVVPDPINPYTYDPDDDTKIIGTNYVAQTPTVGNPANTEMELLIRVVGPGTLTWNDLLVDGSQQQDATMVISIDDGEPILVHQGGMSDWSGQKVVYGGDTDVVHTVRIKFRGDSSGDTVNQAYGYIDNVVWAPYIPVVYEQVKDSESLPFEFENLGTEPTEEKAGETHYYQNGSEDYVIKSTISDVDSNGKQLTSQTTNSVPDNATGTEDYWYAIPDPGPDNVNGNIIAQTAPTLGTNEVAVMHVTGIDGPSKFWWDMLIEEEGDPETPAKLEVVITKTYTDPETSEKTVTVVTNTYTAATIDEWTHAYKPLRGEIGCEYDVDFIFTNNSDGSATCKIDDIGWNRPDINIAPEMYDEDYENKHPTNGSGYGADDKMRPDPTSPYDVNKKSDPYYPGYTLNNESLNPWEVVKDPKTGDKASNPDLTDDDVAQTPDSLESGESTKITVTVEGDGELRWKSFIDSGDGTSDTPATFIVIVDGKTNQVFTSEYESEWTDHVVHVLDSTGVDNATHTVEIIYVQEKSDKPDSTGFVDNFRFEKSITNEQMQDTLVDTDPPSTTVEEERVQVNCTNEVESGWMPYYNESGVLSGVRSADGTEGTADGKLDPNDKEELDSTFDVYVKGTGEIKVDRISVPVEDDPFDPDGGVLTITVDGKVYKFPPPQDDDLSYSIVTNNGIVTVSNLVIKITGDSDVTHDVSFNYHRDAYDITTNTEAIVEKITWKTYGETDDGGSSWLDEGRALMIVDHEPLTNGWVYLAFKPQLKVNEEFQYWFERSASNKLFRAKHGATRAECDACPTILAEPSDLPQHAPKVNKVWVRVHLDEEAQLSHSYWRIFVGGKAMDYQYADEEPKPDLNGPAMAPVPEENVPANPNGEYGADSINVFGILKIESTWTNTMIAVPWTWYSEREKNAEAIPARKLVKATNLTDGDQLYGYKDDLTYVGWVLINGEWQPANAYKVEDVGVGEMKYVADEDETAEEAEANDYENSTRAPRGIGLWLVRQKPTDAEGNPIPFWVYGQSVTNEAESVISSVTATNATKYTTGMSSMIGNPYAQRVVINDLVFEGDIHPDDTIRIPNGTATPLVVHYDATKKKWWYSTAVKTTLGKRTVISSKTMYDAAVEPGLAFWYVRLGEGELKIKWTRPSN